MPFHACTFCTYVGITTGALNAHLDRFIPDLAHLRNGKPRRHPPHPIPILREGRHREINGVTWNRSRTRSKRDVLAVFGEHMETRLASESEKAAWKRRICASVDTDWWMGKVTEAMALYSNEKNRDALATFVNGVVEEARELCDGNSSESDSNSEQPVNRKHKPTTISNHRIALAPTVNINDLYHARNARNDHNDGNDHNERNDRNDRNNDYSDDHSRDPHGNKCHNTHVSVSPSRGGKRGRQDSTSDTDTTTPGPRKKHRSRKVTLKESEEDLSEGCSCSTSKRRKRIGGTFTSPYKPVEPDSRSAEDVKDAPIHIKATEDDITNPVFMLTIKLLTAKHTTITVPIGADTTMSSIIEAAWRKGPEAIKSLDCKKVLVGTGRWQGVWDEATWRSVKKAAEVHPREWRCTVGFGV